METKPQISSDQTPQPSQDEPRYGGFTRFEVELEFVQALSNPQYLNHLAAEHKVLKEPEFVAYLDYLQYWKYPPYLKYLSYPAPTLKILELLQQERFRRDIISPELAYKLEIGGIEAIVAWHQGGDGSGKGT